MAEGHHQMARFQNPRQQQVYDLFIAANPPTTSDGLLSAYKRGVGTGTRPPLRTSLAYAAWAAGREKRRWSQRIKAAQSRRA